MGHAFSSQSFVTTAEHAELRERVAVLEEALKRPRDAEREAGREQRQRTARDVLGAAELQPIEDAGAAVVAFHSPCAARRRRTWTAPRP